jgi:hypothetical protein
MSKIAMFRQLTIPLARENPAEMIPLKSPFHIPSSGQSKGDHLEWLFMRQIFAIAVVTFSVAAIASGQEQGANRDPKKIVEQAIW